MLLNPPTWESNSITPAAFKTYNRLRKIKPIQAIKETIKIIHINGHENPSK